MKDSPRLAILQSLDSMDAVQMEEVLNYIKGVLTPANRTTDYKLFKREAMKEIRAALKNSNGMQHAA